MHQNASEAVLTRAGCISEGRSTVTLFDANISATDAVYLSVRDNPTCAEYRTFAELLWSKFEPFADSNFRSAIAQSFHQRFWEMYLGYTLLQNGLCLRRTGQNAPDIQLMLTKDTIWIEAVAPTVGSGPDAVPSIIDSSCRAQRIPTDQIVLRLRNAIEEKYRKYIGYKKSNVVGKMDPFIIAINPRDIPEMLFDSDPPYIIRSVFPIGKAYVTLDQQTLQIIDQVYCFCPAIKKKSGAYVSTNLFCDPKYSGISAIIYCNSNICMHPPSNDIGIDFTWIPNPLATTPISPNKIPWGRAYVVKDDKLQRLDHRLS